MFDLALRQLATQSGMAWRLDNWQLSQVWLGSYTTGNSVMYGLALGQLATQSGKAWRLDNWQLSNV
jgi:hypothetical protein